MNNVTPGPPGLTPSPLERRLAGLRGDAPQRSLDARALAALAANPGCGRRAVLDAAGVDKADLATRLGNPAPFGQSPFAISRGLGFERKVKADGCTVLLDLLRKELRLPEDSAPVEFAELVGDPKLPAGRVASARAALAAAAARPGVWTVLDQPLLRLEVAGSAAHLEPDLVVVRPDGRWTVVEIKSFPILDGGADAAKVGAAARQAAVYVLALRETAAELAGVEPSRDPYQEPGGLAGSPDSTALLVCPKDFGNQPAAAAVDVRKPMAVTRRQLDRLTGVEQLLDPLPPDAGFGQDRSDGQLTAAVGALAAVYSPDCLSACELGFHCRAEARCAGSVETLGRGVRGELGSFATIDRALAAAAAPPQGAAAPGQDDGDAESALRLSRAAALRAEALGGAALGGDR
ncbi:hypothetical protein [Streptacidiphilus carbonis]|uniref:hypothetical protein n=1 Tax=Streptacidiphilus carbonis TaxID=105422 RepID=UPI000694BCD3|nr:hypothetical protein [Streptacidiphilus carbonis]